MLATGERHWKLFLIIVTSKKEKPTFLYTFTRYALDQWSATCFILRAGFKVGIVSADNLQVVADKYIKIKTNFNCPQV